TMNEVSNDWLNDPDHPERANYANANEVAQALWPGVGGFPGTGNGTGVFDNQDKFEDHNGTPQIPVDPFTPAALVHGVGYKIEQYWHVDGRTVATIDLEYRRKTGQQYEEKKKGLPSP